MAILVLSLFPLTREQEFETHGEPVRRLSLSNLRARTPLGALKELRGRSWDRAVFALTPGDPPEMGSLAELALALARAPRKEYCDTASGKTWQAGRALLARSVGGFLWAGLAGIVAAGRNAMDSWLLSRVPRTRPRVDIKTLHVPYLRASFGLPPIGGSVAHTNGVIAALEATGFEISLFAPSAPAGLSDSCRFVRVQLPRGVTYPYELNRHRYSRFFARRVQMTLRPGGASFVYQRYALNDLSGVRLSSRLGVPLVLEYNGSEIWAQQTWGRRLVLERLSRWIERACLRRADLVVTISDPLRDEVLAAGVASERVLRYPNGVDARLFDPARFGPTERQAARTRLGVPLEASVVTLVSTFDGWHGSEVFAHAIRTLPESLGGQALHFLFIGDGPSAAAVRSILTDEIRHGRVTMAGPRPQTETPATLAASDVLVSPTLPNEDGTAFFGSPTKLFEYMAMAKPIVASDLGQLGAVLSGWTPQEAVPPWGEPLGILVSPGNPATLAAGIEEALRLGASARAALGARARAQVLRAFTWERHVDAILMRLSELSGPIPAPRKEYA